jgi:hypothetical protein
MKYAVQKEEYKKVISKEIEVEIPVNPVYYFLTGIRRAYAIIPVWTSWNKEHYSKDEEIYSLDIVTVDPSLKMIETVNVSLSSLKDTILSEKHNLFRLLENVLLYPDENVRTEEQFMADYNRTIEEIGNKLKKSNPL